MQDTRIYFAADHAGFALKNELLRFVRDELGFSVHDCGAYAYNSEDDFTDFISKASREVSADPHNAKAIILGGSGQGEAMLANRFHDVRAAVYYGGNEAIITLSREHNDANVLSLGARFLEESEAKQAVALWLRTAYQNAEKYDRRIEEMETFSPSPLPRTTLVPSLPAQSFAEIEGLLSSLRGTANGIQIDIVDGQFVPHTSWPFTETAVEQQLLRLEQFTTEFDVEIDCMCLDPQQYLDVFVQIGVHRVVVHYGSTPEIASCIAHAQKHGYLLGLAVNNDTPLQSIEPFVDDIAFVQVMGIRDIGVQGQKFDERTLKTVALLRKVHPCLEIAVDGAVNELTIPRLIQSGVNRFAPGSAIAKAADPKAAYKQLSTLVGL